LNVLANWTFSVVRQLIKLTNVLIYIFTSTESCNIKFTTSANITTKCQEDAVIV